MQTSHGGSAFMTFNEFWVRWRREILQGAALFVAVVAVGMGIVYLVHQAKSRIVTGVTGLASSLEGLHGLAQQFDAPGRTHGYPLDWRGHLSAGQTLWIRDFNGPVVLEPATGTEAVIHSERSWTGTDSAAVRVVFTTSGTGVTACVLTSDSAATCGPEGRYESNVRDGHANVAVKFTVSVPKGVRVNASTVSGDVTGGAVGGPVDVTTVNGDVTLGSTAGPLSVTATNGDVSVTAASGPVRVKGVNGDIKLAVTRLTDDITVETVNGDITLNVPAGINAVLDADSKVGDVTSAFPLVTPPGATERPGVGSHVQSAIGTGGPLLKLHTIRGDVAVEKLAPGAPAAPAAPGAATPAPPRPGTRVIVRPR